MQHILNNLRFYREFIIIVATTLLLSSSNNNKMLHIELLATAIATIATGITDTTITATGCLPGCMPNFNSV